MKIETVNKIGKLAELAWVVLVMAGLFLLVCLAFGDYIGAL